MEAEPASGQSVQRYYDPLCGCFVSTDPVGALSGPFNRYWYANANPYRFTDPDGRYTCSADKNEGCSAIAEALKVVANSASKLPAGSAEQKTLNAIVKFYGKERQKNGVVVKISSSGFASEKMKGQTVTLTFNPAAMRAAFSGRTDGSKPEVEIAGAVAHEGQHGVDDRARGYSSSLTSQLVRDERNGYRTQSYVNEGQGVPSAYGLWSPGITDAQQTQAINQAAANSVAADCSDGSCK